MPKQQTSTLAIIKHIKALEALAHAKLYVGVQGAEAATQHRNAEPGVTVGDIARKNYFGESAHMTPEGWQPAVPARPWLAEAMVRRRSQLQAVVKAAAVSVSKGKIDATKALELVGLFTVGQVQEVMSDGVPPPNADMTIKLKGSSKPLIDSGQLRQSQTYKVVKV